MTTILIDFKERKIVADNQTTLYKRHGDFLGTSGDDYFYPKSTNKIHALPDGAWFVGAGVCSELERQLNRLLDGSIFLDKPRDIVSIAIVRSKNKGLLVDLHEAVESKYLKIKSWEKYLYQSEVKVLTFGSGGSFAYGAFMGGCSAEDSVIAASKCDTYTGLGITVVEVNDGHE
jgi:hypothetical protein